MTTYNVQMMTQKAYNNYMVGSYNYSYDTVKVEAENAKEAAEMVAKMYPTMVINKGYIRSDEELAEIARASETRAKAEAEKKAAAKAKREANEVAKAEAKGMTVEDYKEWKNNYAKMNRKTTEIEKAKAEIEALMAKVARLETERNAIAENMKKIERKA